MGGEGVDDEAVLSDHAVEGLAVEYSIPYAYGSAIECGRWRRDGGREKVKGLDPKIAFLTIFFTGMATLAVEPSWLTFTLPSSITISLLLSILKARGREGLDSSRRIRGDEEW